MVTVAYTGVSTGRKNLMTLGTPNLSRTSASVVPYVPAPGPFFAAMASAMAAVSPPSTTMQMLWPGMPSASGTPPSFA